MSKLFRAVPLIIVIAIALIAGTITVIRIQAPAPQLIKQIDLNTQNQGAQGQAGTTPSASLTIDVIAQHNSASSCYLLISGKVYDVTNFISMHPGGRRNILNSCGTDATYAFETKNGRGGHSSYAYQLLSNYYVGDLGQVLPQTLTQTNTAPQPIAQPVPITQPSPTPAPQPATQQLSMADVSSHSSANGCWLLISSKVYDVTNFISMHPGGRGTILANCGTDATFAFQTKGGGGAHSSYAYQLLDSYYVGTLGQSITTTPTTPPSNPTNIAAGGFRDD